MKSLRLLSSLAILAVTLAACGTYGQGPASPSAPAASSQSSTPKTIVFGLSSEPETLGPFQIGGSFHQGPIYQMVHDFLVVHDDQGQAVAHLAMAQPSMDDGTWQVFPDGSMETTWHLRKGVHWHDGTEFTAADVVFGWKAAVNPSVPWAARILATQIDDIQTPDPYTAVIHWTSLSPFANEPDEWTLDPLPAHILEPVLSSDVQGFINSPFWTREWVGLGPYRLTKWVPGSEMDLQAVSDYFLGSPKIQTVIVRFVTDPNAMIAGFLSGTIDVNTPPTTLTNQHLQTLQDQWQDGAVIRNLSGTLNFVGPNHRVSPFDDVRVRQAMSYAVDRSALADALLIPRSLVADTFLLPGSDKAKRLADRVHVYGYDPEKAQATFAEAGWQRGNDGVLRNAAGQPAEFEFRTTEPQGTIIADMWKAAGLQPSILVPAPNLTSDLQFQADVKGAETSGIGISAATWKRRVHSAGIPTPQNHYAGINRTYYANPEVDALIDQFGVTLDPGERERIEGDLIERTTRDALFSPPLYINAQASVVRKGITGLKPTAGTTNLAPFYYTTWNIVDWDRTSP